MNMKFAKSVFGSTILFKLIIPIILVGQIVIH